MLPYPPWLTEHIPAIIAGACGGLIRTLTAEKKTYGKLASDVLVGAILAVYLGPVAGRILLPGFQFADMDPAQAHSLGSFLAGFGGMVFVELIDGIWRKRTARIAKESHDVGDI